MFTEFWINEISLWLCLNLRYDFEYHFADLMAYWKGAEPNCTSTLEGFQDWKLKL